MRLEDYHMIYFLGIGGIGMSALARWFKREGFAITGYDKTVTPLTNELENEGMRISYKDDRTLLPAALSKEATLVVYTPAVPSDTDLFRYFKENDFALFKRSEILGQITKDMYTVAVAGTHGKTTTSSMIGHMLLSAGRSCSAFIGGIAQNYGTNLLVQKAEGERAVAVVEADEYDRSFLRLYPNLAIVTAIDSDHLDIYGNEESLKQSFRMFIERIAADGTLFINSNLAPEYIQSLPDHLKIEQYGLQKGSIRAENIRIERSTFVFDAVLPNQVMKDFNLQTPGFHNVENAMSAIAVAWSLGLSEKEIRTAISSYGGVKRRFEYVIKTDELVFIDDYAHHPVEIKALMDSVKMLYPDKRITAIFQPHLYSRTRDLADDFAKSFDQADQVLLMSIYPAREQPIEGVSSRLIYDALVTNEKQLSDGEDLLNYLRKDRPEILLTIGAGDIDQMVLPIKELLTREVA
ncbi:MAG: UDP-N-acetylmuramate--L-alanine ligase [Cyclobacteriaceae bacterium]